MKLRPDHKVLFFILISILALGNTYYAQDAGKYADVNGIHAAEMSRLLPSGRLAIIPGNHGSYIGEAMSPDPNSRVPQAFLVMIEEFLAAPVEDKK